MLHATQLHLASWDIEVPRDVSLFCNDFMENFRWTRPAISHIRWDHHPAVHRIVKWANNVTEGRKDTRKSFIKAHLVEGGTIGPVRRESFGFVIRIWGFQRRERL